MLAAGEHLHLWCACVLIGLAQSLSIRATTLAECRHVSRSRQRSSNGDLPHDSICASEVLEEDGSAWCAQCRIHVHYVCGTECLSCRHWFCHTCRGSHWCHPMSSEAAEPLVQVQKEVPTDGPTSEPGAPCASAPCASAPATSTFDRGVKVYVAGPRLCLLGDTQA